MSYVKQTNGPMKVIGVSIRTTNADFQKIVGGIWEKFFREEGKIPRKNEELLGLYTDYETDYTGPFTYMIGYEVESLDNIPQGLVGIELDPSPYAVFTAKGEFPQSMKDAWGEIWNSNLNRSYTTDFEIYGKNINLQTNPEVKICIALKK